MLRNYLSGPAYQSLKKERLRRALIKYQSDKLVIPQTDEQLKDAVYQVTGLTVPDVKVCPNHVAPFTALSDAFFARHGISVWWASRGFGGKSVLLAVLSMLEACYFGAAVNLLGGSSEQSARVHGYMTGEDTNLPDTFWGWSGAPRSLLLDDPTLYKTRLVNGGRINVLTASQKSIRGSHPQKLRADEIDEMDIEILDAALGQPMEARGIKSQTVLSSTYQHPNGTMAEVLDRADKRGYPVYTWCYKETLHGWLTEEAIANKRNEVTENMWRIEYDLQKPAAGARAINFTEKMFDRSLGEFEGFPDEYICIEAPVREGEYVTGADWAKEVNWTVIQTMRIDKKPYKVVSWRRTARKPWPLMAADFDAEVKKYNSQATHDATGIGGVIADYITVPAGGIVLSGKIRTEILSRYTVAAESGDIVGPYIKYAHDEHMKATWNDLYGTGHLPDSICAGALANAAVSGAWTAGMGG